MKLDLITNKAQITNDKNPNDEFYTPKYAIIPMLKYLKKNSLIWCPFDTEESNYVKILKENGHQVINTHIDSGVDFFNCAIPLKIDYIISNPPYSLKTQVLAKLFGLNIPFCMLIGVVGLFESQSRFSMFRNNDFEMMYFDKRISYFKDYSDPKPSLNPPFSSVYVCKNVLPKQIIFETINKNK